MAPRSAGEAVEVGLLGERFHLDAIRSSPGLADERGEDSSGAGGGGAPGIRSSSRPGGRAGPSVGRNDGALDLLDRMPPPRLARMRPLRRVDVGHGRPRPRGPGGRRADRGRRRAGTGRPGLASSPGPPPPPRLHPLAGCPGALRPRPHARLQLPSRRRHPVLRGGGAPRPVLRDVLVGDRAGVRPPHQQPGGAAGGQRGGARRAPDGPGRRPPAPSATTSRRWPRDTPPTRRPTGARSTRPMRRRCGASRPADPTTWTRRCSTPRP